MIQGLFERTLTFLVHEMPSLLRERGLVEDARIGAEQAARIVFAASSVADRFAEIVAFDDAKRLILPQGAYHVPAITRHTRASRRRQLHLGSRTILVLAAGYGDLRKGFDLFLQCWRAARRADADAAFCWLGDLDPSLATYLAPEIASAEATGSFHVVPHQRPVDPWFAAADVFVLPSREDPYPSVVLEAMKAGLPVAAFEGSGGMPGLIAEHGCGMSVTMGDATALAEAAILLGQLAATLRPQRQQAAQRLFSFQAYAGRLLRHAAPELQTVSVVLVSYNYAQFMPTRLASILSQTYPVQQVMLIDDASTDDSVSIAREVARSMNRTIDVRVNAHNAGSPFAAWRRAAEQASGDYVWIAEADDIADDRFLATLCARLQGRPDIELAFCDSRAIDASGAEIWPNYKEYYRQNGASALLTDQVFEARDFTRRFLAARNLILNVSAVVWRRASLIAALQRCEDDLRCARAAGDWRLYVEALGESDGRVAYVAQPLNAHRRHDASVSGLVAPATLREEAARIHGVINTRVPATAAIRRAQRKFLATIGGA